MRTPKIIIPNPYGYQVDINHPDIRPVYEAFKSKKGIPYTTPLSHAERMEFEKEYLSKRKIP